MLMVVVSSSWFDVPRFQNRIEKRKRKTKHQEQRTTNYEPTTINQQPSPINLHGRLLEALTRFREIVPSGIETASGRVFEVPHRDYVSFSPKRTSPLQSSLKSGAKNTCHHPAADRDSGHGQSVIQRAKGDCC
ncbi:MAG: hypothetical protein KIT22_00685 [Verrucomicrobiae bacterium]|nr:hypothetical protein [Verrucomicrobiae bacterium]